MQLQIFTKEKALAPKYLGIHNILNITSTTKVNILSTDAQRVGLWIETRRASAAVIIMVYNAYVLQRIRYYAPYLTSSLEEMKEKLDKPVQKLLRRITKKHDIFLNETTPSAEEDGGTRTQMPDRHHNINDDVTHPQSAAAIGRCSQRSSGTTNEAQTTALGPISRWTTASANSRHTKLLGTLPTAAPG